MLGSASMNVNLYVAWVHLLLGLLECEVHEHLGVIRGVGNFGSQYEAGWPPHHLESIFATHRAFHWAALL